MQHHLVFVDMKYFFVQHQHVFSTPNYFLCNVKHFVSTQNHFSCNTKFWFWTSFRMLCHGDIFLVSHSNKNIIMCQKINKVSFLCDKKIKESQFFYMQFLYYTLPAF